MRLGGYLFVVKAELLSGLTYRFEIVAGLATRLVLMSTAVYLWRAAFSGDIEARGTVEGDMVRYAVMSTAIAPLLATKVQATIHERVRTGDISLDLLRPIRLPLRWLAEDVGTVLSAGLLQILPLLVVAALLFGAPVPASGPAVVLFVASLGLSFGILWLLAALCGLIAVWTAEIGNLGYVKDAVLRILSGSLVPLWFFPDWAREISRFLPFQYTYQTPLAIFIGRGATTAEAGTWLLAQAAWILVLGAVFGWLWSRGRRRLFVQGG